MDLRVGTKIDLMSRTDRPKLLGSDRRPRRHGGATHNIWSGAPRPRAVRRFHHTMDRGVEIGAGKLTSPVRLRPAAT
jgi:hypothetical protein